MSYVLMGEDGYVGDLCTNRGLEDLAKFVRGQEAAVKLDQMIGEGMTTDPQGVVRELEALAEGANVDIRSTLDNLGALLGRTKEVAIITQDAGGEEEESITHDEGPMLGDRTIFGYPVVVEQERGEMRYGRKLPADYGFIRRTDSAEPDDQLDAFIGEDFASDKIFIIDSYRQDASFDEHKIMMMFTDAGEAMKVFKAYYPEARAVCSEVGHAVFADWVKHGNKKVAFQQPFNSQYTPRGTNPATRCAGCLYYEPTTSACTEEKVQRDPRVPENAVCKQVQPTGWCKEWRKR